MADRSLSEPPKVPKPVRNPERKTMSVEAPCVFIGRVLRTGDAWRPEYGYAAKGALRGGGADPDFVEMVQQIGRVLVHPIRAGPLELFLSVAPGEEADRQRARPAGGQEIPDTVAHHDRVLDVGA